MNLKTYQENRSRRLAAQKRPREVCLTCYQPSLGCYCRNLQPFHPRVEFVILIHPIEIKRRIATGRMSHLILNGSRLIKGGDFSDDERVYRIIEDNPRGCYVLYPGPTSINLSELADEDKRTQFPATGKNLTVFVIDGTWATARAMLRSENLRRLPRISFTSTEESRFIVRKQPLPQCLSTIEAIHKTIEQLAPVSGFDVQSRRHDHLLDVFGQMVKRQLAFSSSFKNTRAERAKGIGP